VGRIRGERGRAQNNVAGREATRAQAGAKAGWGGR
jgi:hypothetical protein